MNIDSLLPEGKYWREFWDFEAVNGLIVPSKVRDGHALTLTNGAAKRTTANGVHFTGGATSNIVVGSNAIQNAQAAFHITIRFKLDATFEAGAAADQYLFQKLLAADDYLRVYLSAADGKLYWEQGDLGGGIQFTLTSTTVSWTAGTQYTVTVSLTDTPVQRLIVNGTAEDTDTAAAVATPNGGDMVIGSSSDGGADGIIGTISWVVIGVGTTAVTALTAAEEADLAKGIPPATAKVQYLFTMDEGRGVTATDRGSAGGNGALDSACTWDFDTRKLACLSPDGINDYASSAAVCDVSGDMSLVFVLKAKCTYNALARDKIIVYISVDATNIIQFYNYVVNNDLRFFIYTGGTSNSITTSYKPAIDDYIVIVLTRLSSTGVNRFFLNGAYVGTCTTAGAMSAAGATAFLGGTVSYPDVSKNIMSGIINGTLTDKEVLMLSRRIDQRYNLRIGV